MTRTVMNKEDNEYKVYYLKELKRLGMTDEELRWMYENLTLSMISNIHSYPNRCIRFEYWFNVIKDINVSSDGVYYNSPYAHYQFEGIVYGPNIPIFENGVIVGWWSRPNKQPT